MDFRGGYVSKILYVKMKELGPLGGVCTGHAPLYLPMPAIGTIVKQCIPMGIAWDCFHTGIAIATLLTNDSVPNS